MRDEPKYFDRRLAISISKYYPEFLENKIPENFKNKILFEFTNDRLEETLYPFIKEFNFNYQFIKGWYIFEQEEFNLFRLLRYEFLFDFDYHKGKDIGQLLLNEINDFQLSYR